MRILVIGGTGFIGRHVCRELAAAEHEVTVLHRGAHDGDLPEAVRHVRDPAARVPVLSFPDVVRRDWDAVVHMVPIGESDARAAVEAFRGVAGRMVVVSSGDVYRAFGQCLGTEAPPPAPASASLDEDAPLRQNLFPYGAVTERGPYGRLEGYDKILVERTFAAAGAALPATILRLPKCYGPLDRAQGLAGWIRRIESGDAVLVGEKEAGWRWSHGYVEDVAHAIALAAVAPGAGGRTYNVGEPETPTQRERAVLLARALGRPPDVRVVAEAELPAELRMTIPLGADVAYDTSRIRRELGYVEVVERDEGLRRTAASVTPPRP